MVADQVLLGQDQPVAECSEEGQIARVAQLKRPVDDIRPRTPGARGLTIGDERHAGSDSRRPSHTRSGHRARSRSAAPCRSARARDHLECVHVRSDRGAREDACVDRDRREAGDRRRILPAARLAGARIPAFWIAPIGIAGTGRRSRTSTSSASTWESPASVHSPRRVSAVSAPINSSRAAANVDARCAAARAAVTRGRSRSERLARSPSSSSGPRPWTSTSSCVSALAVATRCWWRRVLQPAEPAARHDAAGLDRTTPRRPARRRGAGPSARSRARGLAPRRRVA